jgi:hypothetical protein
MSHKAVSWALDQRHLKPAPWVVLIQLADRHNKDTLRCDPDQATLAADCNMSRATVNRHLDTLEELEMIRRVPRIDPRTGKSLSTFYILGLNFDRPPHIENAVSQTETRKNRGQKENKSSGHVSNCDTVPCLKKRENHVSKNAKTMSQNETLTFVREPVKEPCAASAPHKSDFDFDGFFAEFVGAYPRMGDPEATEESLKEALGAGAEPKEILAGARAYATEQAGNKPRFIKYSENWIDEKRWRQHVTAPVESVDPQKVLEARAQEILERKPWARTIKPSQAGECIAAGLVTAADCQAAGINV